MAEISVNFMHPTDGRVITVSLDDEITGIEVIGELIANDFIPSSSDGYQLAIKGGDMLDNNISLASNGVENNVTIRIIPATDAGNHH